MKRRTLMKLGAEHCDDEHIDEVVEASLEALHLLNKDLNLQQNFEMKYTNVSEEDTAWLTISEEDLMKKNSVYYRYKNEKEPGSASFDVNDIFQVHSFKTWCHNL